MVRAKVPESVMATWPAPNYVDPASRGPALNILAVIMLCIVFIVLGLRVYVRGVMLRAFGADDWLILLCILPAICLNVTAYTSTSYGWGKHYWDQKTEWWVPAELISWTIQVCYIFNMYLAKMSLLCTYLRFISGRRLRIFIWVVMGVVSAWFMGCFFSTLFACYPVNQYWLSTTGHGCTNEADRLLVCVFANIVTDFVVVFIPLPTIWKIQLPMREKAVLGVLLSIGVIASVASIVRTVVMEYTISTWDSSWWGYYVWLCTCLECNLAIICPSVPPLRPMLRPIVKKSRQLFQSTHIRSRCHSKEHFLPEDPELALPREDISSAQAQTHEKRGSESTLGKVTSSHSSSDVDLTSHTTSPSYGDASV